MDVLEYLSIRLHVLRFQIHYLAADHAVGGARPDRNLLDDPHA